MEEVKHRNRTPVLFLSRASLLAFMRYYVDTCVYLNLFKREIAGSVEIWRIAEEFFFKAEKRRETIYYSGFVLKELAFILGQEFESKTRGLFDQPVFERVLASQGDCAQARRLESESGFRVSFFDCMHLTLAKRKEAVLVTRDAKLLALSEGRCHARKPEQLL